MTDTPSPKDPAAAKPALAARPPPSRGDKLRRGAWQGVRLLLFRPSLIPMHGWRRFLLRRFGAVVEEDVAVYPSAAIWAPWNVTLRRGATIGSGATLYCVDRIEIGAHAIVSQGAHLCTASHDHNRPGFDLVSAPIRLGPHAWVAAESFVGPGVEIGDGAVVGARAVLFRSLEARAVAVGNPARVVARRAGGAENRLRRHPPARDGSAAAPGTSEA